MKFTDPKTHVKRIHDFLCDAHRQLRRDDMPRMLYTAMTYRLSWMHMGIAVRLGYIQRGGWRWYWTAKTPPTMEMAERLHKKLLDVNRELRYVRSQQNSRASKNRR